MNWVFENLVQRPLNGLEDILLKLHSQIGCDNLFRTKEQSKIWEDDLPDDSIIETQDFEGKCLGDSTKKIREFQEIL